MGNRNTTSENSIEKYFVKKCKEQGMKVIKMVPTFEAGIPDRQVMASGFSGFAEIKAPGKKPRANQIAYLNALRDAGFYTGVVDSKESALKWIEGFVKHIEDILCEPLFCPVCGKQNKPQK